MDDAVCGGQAEKGPNLEPTLQRAYEELFREQMCVENQIYMYLIQHSGAWWQQLALRLDLRDKILDIKMRSVDTIGFEGAMTYLIDEWMRRKGRRATVGALLDALKSVNELELYNNVISKFVQHMH